MPKRGVTCTGLFQEVGPPRNRLLQGKVEQGFVAHRCSPGSDRVEALLRPHETTDIFLVRSEGNPEPTKDSNSDQIEDDAGAAWPEKEPFARLK